MSLGLMSAMGGVTYFTGFVNRCAPFDEHNRVVDEICSTHYSYKSSMKVDTKTYLSQKLLPTIQSILPRPASHFERGRTLVHLGSLPRLKTISACCETLATFDKG
jgi:hypothetical protein